jgi:hypothetical protein
MKKIIITCSLFIIFLWVVMFVASCTPVRYVYVDPKDSTIHKQRVIYNNVYESYTPLYFNYDFYPYYRPNIVHIRPYYEPRPYYIPRSFRRGR